MGEKEKAKQHRNKRVTDGTRGLGWYFRYSDSLRDSRCGDRNPVAAKFCSLFWLALGATQPTLESVEGLVPGVKRLGYGVDQSPSSSAKDKEKVELYLLLVWVSLVWCWVNISFTSTSIKGKDVYEWRAIVNCEQQDWNIDRQSQLYLYISLLLATCFDFCEGLR